MKNTLKLENIKKWYNRNKLIFASVLSFIPLFSIFGIVLAKEQNNLLLFIISISIAVGSMILSTKLLNKVGMEE